MTPSDSATYDCFSYAILQAVPLSVRPFIRSSRRTLQMHVEDETSFLSKKGSPDSRSLGSRRRHHGLLLCGLERFGSVGLSGSQSSTQGKDAHLCLSAIALSAVFMLN